MNLLLSNIAQQQRPLLLASSSWYGLGSLRSLQDLYSFTGIDFARRSISSKAQWGGLHPQRFKPEVKKEKLDLIIQLMQRHMKTCS